MTSIQLDFGGFSTCFPGATIKFANKRAWNTWDSFITASTPLLPGDDVADEEVFEAIALTSTLSHEVRHFHDFLLTPNSAHLFRLRTQGLFNLLGALRNLPDSDADCLPVPVLAWCSLDEAKRDSELRFFGRRSDGTSRVPLPLPMISDWSVPNDAGGPATLEMLLRAAAVTENRIHDFTYNRGTDTRGFSFQPWQIYELSAVLTQLQDIFTTYGVEEMNFFLRFLQERQSPYSTVLLFAKPLTDNMRLLSWITFWSLLGSYQKDDWKACPTHRFLRLADYTLNGGVLEETEDPLEAFGIWSAEFGLSTVEEGVAETEKMFRRTVEYAHKYAEHSPDHWAELLVRTTTGIANASHHMCSQVLSDPTNYVNLLNYLNSPSWVDPVLRLVFDGVFLHPKGTLDELTKKGRVIDWATESEQGLLIESMTQPFSPYGNKCVTAEDATELAGLFAAVDFVFGGAGRARREVQRAREFFFEETGLTPRELL